jgi:hypothetical protein
MNSSEALTNRCDTTHKHGGESHRWTEAIQDSVGALWRFEITTIAACTGGIPFPLGVPGILFPAFAFRSALFVLSALPLPLVQIALAMLPIALVILVLAALAIAVTTLALCLLALSVTRAPVAVVCTAPVIGFAAFAIGLAPVVLAAFAIGLAAFAFVVPAAILGQR